MKHVETARNLVTAATVALLAASGTAYARPDVRTMSCAHAQAFLESKGAVVFTTGKYTYDRFISGTSFCPLPDVPVLTYVQTRDNPQCPVGYTCQQNTDDGTFGQ